MRKPCPQARQLLEYGMDPEVFSCPSTRVYELRLADGYWDVSATTLGRYGTGNEVAIGYWKPGGTDPDDPGGHYNCMYNFPLLDPKPVPLAMGAPADWVVLSDAVFRDTNSSTGFISNHLRSSPGSGWDGSMGYVSAEDVPGGNSAHVDGAVDWKPFSKMNANYVRHNNENYW